MRRLVLLGVLTAALTALATSCGGSNGCEDARGEVVDQMHAICKEPAYAASAFCSTCVAKHYYSTTGASDCRCKVLTFDQDFCSYLKGSDARSRVRSAIDYANESCAAFAFEAQDGAGAETSDAP